MTICALGRREPLSIENFSTQCPVVSILPGRSWKDADRLDAHASKPIFAVLNALKDVASLCVMLRPLLSPARAERLAGVIFAREIEAMPVGRMPLRPMPHLMRDGTGRRGQVEQNPDPYAERVRRPIADQEILQAIGRARVINCTPANPVTCTLVGWNSLGDHAQPVDQLISREKFKAQLDWPTALLVAGVWCEGKNQARVLKEALEPGSSWRGSYWRIQDNLWACPCEMAPRPEA